MGKTPSQKYPKIHYWIGAAFKLVEFTAIVVVLLQFGAWLDQRNALAVAAGWQTIASSQGGRVEALRDLDARGVSLRHSTLTDLVLAGDSLRRFDLRHANLNRAVVEGASLACSQLDSATFFASRLVRSDFSAASIIGADFSGSWASDEVLFRAVDGRYARFKGMTGGGIDFEAGNLSYASFDSITLDRARFTRTDLTFAHFDNATVYAGDFTHAVVRYASLGGASLRGSVFRNADMRFADLDGIRDWRDILDVEGANIAGVRNAPPGFVEWAVSRGAIADPTRPLGVPRSAATEGCGS